MGAYAPEVKMKNILFVCKYNRFRSKVAESIFNKLNKNKQMKARSAGIIRGSKITKEILDSSNKMGYTIKGKPAGINTDLLIWQDTIIIVANDVPASLFADNKKYGKKLVVWKIPDVKELDRKPHPKGYSKTHQSFFDVNSSKNKARQRIIKMIENKVRAYFDSPL